MRKTDRGPVQKTKKLWKKTYNKDIINIQMDKVKVRRNTETQWGRHKRHEETERQKDSYTKQREKQIEIERDKNVQIKSKRLCEELNRYID